MNYITAKELAEKWGISLRSVQYFCSNGRIPGAKNIGRQWIIPDNAARPADSRFKNVQPNAYPYRFPLFFFSTAYTSCNGLNSQENTLLSAQLKQLEGYYTESIGICRELIRFEAPCHVLMGAYYTIALCSIILGNHYEYKKALNAMESAVSSDDTHIEDYKLIIASIKRIIGWDHSVFDNIDISKLSSDALCLYQYECLLSVVLGGENVSVYSLHIYDAFVHEVSLKGISPLEANIRFALAALHMRTTDSMAEEYIEIACKICVNHNWVSLIAKNMSLGKTLIKKSLDKNAPGYFRKVSEISDRDYNNWRIINRQESGVFPFEIFSPSDISMLFMIYQGLSNSQICTIMDLSPKNLQVALHNCYKAANVKTRKELRDYTVSQISTWFKV